MTESLPILDSLNIDSFIFDSILYTKMRLPEDDSSLIGFFDIGYSKRLYCPDCSDVSVFKHSDLTISKRNFYKSDSEKINYENSTTSPGKLGRISSHQELRPSNTIIKNCIQYLEFVCSYNPKHVLKFYFIVEGNLIIKVGQHPKTADLKFPQKNRYNEYLGNYVIEYKTSLQEASNGVGIGSFVYLRRILEFLVEEIHQKLINNPGWDEKAYKGLEFKDKMDLCNSQYSIIPDEINSYKSLIYKVLSKGIHSLDEDECISLFPSLQVIIETILEKKIENIKKDETLANAVKNLNTYNSNIKD